MTITVITDGTSRDPLGQELRSALAGWLEQSRHDYRIRELRPDRLHPCAGCFHCWIKTPGCCVINDDAGPILRDFIRSRALLLLSPVKYGSYSPLIHRLLHRSIPMVLPYFKKINGEVHHQPRYLQYPRLVAIGYGATITGAEAETFKSLTDANAVNFQTREAETYICRDRAAIEPILGSLQRHLGRLDPSGAAGGGDR